MCNSVPECPFNEYIVLLRHIILSQLHNNNNKIKIKLNSKDAQA